MFNDSYTYWIGYFNEDISIYILSYPISTSFSKALWGSGSIPFAEFLSDIYINKWNKFSHSCSPSNYYIIFQGDKFDTDYFEMIPVAGFLTNATFYSLEVYFKNMKGPILGKAHLEALDLFINTS